MNIAVLGYGVVGTGVVEIINSNKERLEARTGKTAEVTKILDIRDIPNDPNAHLLTKNADEIFNDASIEIVVETIGGAGIAFELTKRALTSGKSVVTSNKELVATHGPELLQMAAENNAIYMFEASVGGGIPIIRPLYNCLAANEIHHIIGILNGTTNYILTAMKKDGKSFEAALKEAQEKGYAESDPTADVEGHDACRKIAILSSIAFNEFVDYKDIETEGISNVTLEDMTIVDSKDYAIKLVGESIKTENGIFARVSPVLLPKSNPLSNVDDVFNAIMVDGDAVGTAMFYGRGAGKMPTASAVVADVMDIMKKCTCNEQTNLWSRENKSPLLTKDMLTSKYYLKLSSSENLDALKSTINEIFGKQNYIYSNLKDNVSITSFITDLDSEANIEKFIELAKERSIAVLSKIRVISSEI